MKTLKQVAMAEKLSTPQLQQAVKDGTIESWIGIPMLQERMKEQKQAQAMAAAQQPKQPPIAEQVMAEASGVGALPSNLPQEYAQGGILGYAEGGETDEQYQQYLDDAEEEEFDRYAAAMLNRTPSVEQGLRSAPSMSYGQVQGVAPRAARQSAPAESKYDASGHKYDEIASKRAEERGMPAGLARFMLHKETGGLKNPDTATSKAGAYGPAQIMPATAKSRGINYKDPVENVLGGVDYLAEMYHKYDKNPELALAAYNAGPGRVDRALKSGQGIAGLPTETKGYVKFASGGIAHFEDGGNVDPLTGESIDLTEEEPTTLAGKIYKERGLFGPNILRGQPKTQSIGIPAAIQAGTNPRALDNASMTAEKKYEQQVKEEKLAPKPPAGEENKGEEAPKAQSAYDRLMAHMEENLANREKQKTEDKWMGLLQAGLGMMGGTSPYGAVNVGQGAMYGVQQYGQARKAAAAEEASTLKNMLTAERYRELGDYYKGRGEETQAQHEAANRLRKQEIANKGLSYMQERWMQEADRRYGKDVNMMTPEVRAQRDAFLDSMKKDPKWIEYESTIIGPAAYGGLQYKGIVPK